MTNPDLFHALCKAQEEFPPIERSKTVSVKTKAGGAYSFDYAPLDAIFAAIRPTLAKYGLAVSQLLTESANGAPALETVLTHSAGGSLRGTVPLPATNGMSAQEFGSLVTYYRRYGLVAALGIATEDDDDGNHASGNSAVGNLLTKAQNGKIGMLVSKLTEANVTDIESVRTWMGATFGKTSRASLTKKEASELIEWLVEKEEAAGLAA